ncbi:hypothetical protein SARC_12992 [Sphaeroforma arctica JP610]|uniref:EF-hand domain-containing protein n=1 Tax=Sphaeroforma arctica JP610 TaxID=667725 RepID=A0A0L0FCG0_9EUKA|nr:hypothetical protein SARC_12992 [Sphaeroforma arctica JP610]KNC74462.1 hypothetical protein SARC_12992 [Sphaeroforma arctica JP610]|eukprot:XP_014148364.1 hypothetical protein SARC_12992 [Sphaeroforma arctica JP610]
MDDKAQEGDIQKDPSQNEEPPALPKAADAGYIEVPMNFRAQDKLRAVFKRTFSRTSCKRDVRKRDIVQAYSVHYRKLLVVGPLILLYVLLGAVIFDLIEGGSENDLTFLDSTYWAIVTITTVGYGDISPQTAGGKVWTIIYIFIGLTLIVSAIAYIMDLVHDLKVELNQLRKETEPLPTLRSVVVSVAITVIIMASLILVGAVFYSIELGLMYLDSVYLAVITLTTVGYGDLSVDTEKARLFSVFYILFGVNIFLGRLSMITQTVNKYVEYRRIQKLIDRGVTADLIYDMDTTGDGEIDLLEFSLGFLIRMGKINERDVTRLRVLFKKLDKDGDGKLGYTDFTNDEEKKRMELRYLSLSTATETADGERMHKVDSVDSIIEGKNGECVERNATDQTTPTSHGLDPIEARGDGCE